MAQATVIGAGPNGLAAAITLAQAGVQVRVLERNAYPGGACTTGELTLPGFRHDLGSSVYPMGAASPFFRSLASSGREELPWVQPEACCAHPLDDGTAVMLERDVEATADGLGRVDAAAYRALMGWMPENFVALAEDLLGPVQHVPKHPLLLARFGVSAMLPARALATLRFGGTRARALFAGMAAHSVQALEAPVSAAVGMVLLGAGHGVGWPVARGGAESLTARLVAELEALGGVIETGAEVTSLPWSDGVESLVVADVTPRQLLRMEGGRLPAGYRRELENFRYGAGAFKVDYALSEPIPWTAKECLRAATVHVGGTMEEVADSEREFLSDKPFVLLVQPSLADPTRAPEGKHTAWAYCHVPQGSSRDCLGLIEAQIERFAPGFAECVLARAVSGPAALEQWNANLVGGDVSGGEMGVKQLLARPTLGLYRTPVAGLFFCGASTPPGGGVHGMAGYHAAKVALRS